MGLARHSVSGVGAAQGDALVDGHLVADLGAFADHGEAVVDEEMAADGRAGMDVDGGQKARQVVDGAGEEIKLALEQPVRDAVQPQRQHTRIKQHFPARARRRVARSEEHTSELQSLMRISYAVFCLKKNTKNTI